MASTDVVTEGTLDAYNVVVAAKLNLLKNRIGTLTSLNTTAKGNLVDAINEVLASVAGAAGIADGSMGTSTTWSSQKVNDQIAAAVASILGPGVGAAYDTLKELQTALETDDTDIAALVTSVGNRLRVDAAQGLASPQQAQGRANLGIIYSTYDAAAALNAAVTS